MAMFVDSQSTCLEIWEIWCSWLNIEKVQWTCDKNFVCGNILTGFFLIDFFKDQRDKIVICSIKKASTSTNQKKKKKNDYK